MKNQITIYRDGVFAGQGTIDGDNEIECNAVLGPDQDASDATYEAITDAIGLAPQDEGRYTGTGSIQRPDGEYSWEVKQLLEEELARYAVYVTDPNGWDEGCPDSEAVFFGTDHGGTYYRHTYDQDLGQQGFVVVASYDAAVALQNRLNATGDWVAPEEINPDHEETRPEYGVAKVTADLE
jgi:hypothetical protein